jgi:hypothetical protein
MRQAGSPACLLGLSIWPVAGFWEFVLGSRPLMLENHLFLSNWLV